MHFINSCGLIGIHVLGVFLIVVQQYSEVYNQMIVQCTGFEVEILKKPKLKNVVRNIKLVFIKDFFPVL